MPLPPEYLGTVFLLDRPADSLPGSFAIITAWNPMHQATDASENELRDGELKERLVQRGFPHFRATGCAPDLSHLEPGWAITMDAEEALALGREFRQLAVWWISGDDLFLVDCADGGHELVGSFRGRVRTLDSA
jgi:hypothetical protein